MSLVAIEDILKNYRHDFAPVVPFQPETDRLLQLDFTVANTELTADILNNTGKFCDYINQKLKVAAAKYGIGGYNEHRTVYSRSPVFDAERTGEEPRRLHLGTDIWGDAGTAVMAPLDSVVHSFAFNDRFGDYGTTIILSHVLEGISFYTLYGHLGLDSIMNLEEGKPIQKGEVFANFGIPEENGHWPPHLHFQVVKDLQGWKGDYPGVCKFTERETYLQNCPDPDLLLQFNQYIG
ncbi:MAG: peptidoglycan DD-metalloendopeptidase family protein [Chitinophagales bacterium]|nr:peptidoglycan DD-metalloendopeptidase family protein [Chitinophagales bacterium]